MRWRGGALRDSLARTFTDRVILVIGWALFLVYSFPGYMSYDSVWQLSQARRNEPLNEWHPPMMAFLWRYLDALIAGPFLMLVLQSVTFLVGLYLLLRRVMSGRAAAIVAVVMLLLPQNIVVMAVIWKDSQMAGFLLAAMACFYSEKLRWRILGCLFVFLATGFRYNAAAATFPIVVLLWDRRENVWWLRRYGLATALWVGLTVLAFVANSAITQKRMYPWQTGAAPVDIVGVIRFSPHYDNDQLLRDTEGVPWIYKDKIQIRTRSTYRAEHSFLDVTQGHYALMEYIQTDEQRKAIGAAWKKLVFAHPYAFLRHRIGVFGAQLASHGSVWGGFTNADWAEDLLKHRGSHSAIQDAWIMKNVKLAQTWLFHIGLYFFLAIVLLPFCRRQRLAFVFLISAIFHEIGLFLVAPAVDYRYSQWMVFATIVGAVTLFATRRAHREAGERLPRATRPTPP